VTTEMLQNRRAALLSRATSQAATAGGVQTRGADLVFVYGGWDLWSGGMFHLGNATDALELTVLEGTHDSSVADLTTSDQDAVYARLAAWAGVTLHAPHARPHPSRDPRRALRYARSH
jgi:hypothetical protein